MSSNIYCGGDLTAEIKTALDACAFVVTDDTVAKLYPEITRGAFAIPSGEKYKTTETLLSIIEEMRVRGVKRTDRIAAVGGGVVGDITGLAAALYMRGVEWVNVPTTLLAMVDSGIGGKTAVDFGGVKNLIGAFHEASDIYISSVFLNTLPPREWKCGYGELIKTCLLTKDAYAALCDTAELAEDADGIYPLVMRCVDIKKAVVAADPKEKNLRKVLNIGHTVGHALESLDGYRLSHGEYVMKGMMTEAAMCRDMIDAQFYGGYIKLLSAFTAAPRTTAKLLSEKAAFDKKNTDGDITVMFPVRAGEITEARIPRDEFEARYTAAIKELRSV